MTAREVNFDGLPGLTHHYAGLSFGNEASTRHRYRVSNPQLAAKQGLKKMKALADAGYPQAVIPPQERPNVPLLRQLGFSGSDEQVVARVAQQEPDLLSAVSSASAMWVANAATVCSTEAVRANSRPPVQSWVIWSPLPSISTRTSIWSGKRRNLSLRIQTSRSIVSLYVPLHQRLRLRISLVR